MLKNAYCMGCRSRVQLTEAGECPEGHPRSMLRDVQEGLAAPAPDPVSTSAEESEGRADLNPSEETAAKVIGMLVIVVPATVVLVFAFWLTYAISVGMGWSKTASFWSTIVELLFVAGGVWFVAWRRRGKLGR